MKAKFMNPLKIFGLIIRVKTISSLMRMNINRC